MVAGDNLDHGDHRGDEQGEDGGAPRAEEKAAASAEPDDRGRGCRRASSATPLPASTSKSDSATPTPERHCRPPLRRDSVVPEVVQHRLGRRRLAGWCLSTQRPLTTATLNRSLRGRPGSRPSRLISLRIFPQSPSSSSTFRLSVLRMICGSGLPKKPPGGGLVVRARAAAARHPPGHGRVRSADAGGWLRWRGPGWPLTTLWKSRGWGENFAVR
jgi:hypothetical protein